MALLAPFRAMTARGLRVNDALRRDRLAALTEEAARLATEAQPIVEGVLDRLARRDLVEWWTVCKVCHNGKNKHLSCDACGKLGRERVFSFNLASEKQLKDVLYKGLALPTRTRDKRVTTDEEALESLLALDKSGLVRLALRHAKLDTMRAIYERLAPAPDGHVRTVLNPAGTYTGRPNSAEAFYVPHSTNLHNLPAEEARADPLFAARDCIVPDEGEVFVYADLAQAEARIVAALSEDKRLLDGWARDPEWDVHTWTAEHILQARGDVTAQQRQTCGKRPRHALNYGMGPGKFWRVLNAAGAALTRKQTDAIYTGYHKLHPNLDGLWWERVEHALETDGFVETVFGRRLTFWPRFDPVTGSLDPETLRAAIAAEPQSTVADLTNRAVVALFERESAGFRLLHHALDAILVSCKPNAVRSTARLLKEGLEWEIVVNGTSVMVPAQVYVAPQSWSACERIL